MSTFYLTTAIDYVNSRPHLGTAYEKVTADVIARYQRLCGVDTHFVMGNDEHSQNVFKRARELGLEPQAYCDQMAGEFEEVWAGLHISYDDFIRTTEVRHRVGVQTMVERIAAAGDLYQADYEGWYCVSCEAFKQEKDLVDGLCPIHRTKPDWIRERNHFFRLSAYRDRLLAHIQAHTDFIQPEVRRNEILRLLEGGLDDISVSRAGQSWGIPLPNDPASVVYVWFDALINYASAVGYGSDELLMQQWWPADLHVIGKDITRFHCVIWPAMLMSAGLPLPRAVFGHGWVHLRGEKMSKSLGTSVDPLEAASRFGVDALRLYLVKEIPYGADGDFSWERLEDRYNADLANNLGNLASRITAMADRYRGGTLAPAGGGGRLAPLASEVLAVYRTAMNQYALHQGAAAAFRLVDATNEYIAEQQPWALAKDTAQAAALDEVLFTAAEAVRVAATLLLPVMPAAATRLLERVGAGARVEGVRLDVDGPWRSEGHRQVIKGEALWPRTDGAGHVTLVLSGTRPEAGPVKGTETITGTGTDVQMTENETPVASAPPVAHADQPPAVTPAAAASSPVAAGESYIGIDDFAKVELRVGRVLAAERVAKSKKLLKLTVQDGPDSERTILAGLAESYEPEQITGRSIVFVANLQPRPMMGLVSHGMVLAAETDGRAQLLSFETPPTPGTSIR